jgi:hypothetical protein
MSEAGNIVLNTTNSKNKTNIIIDGIVTKKKFLAK